MSSRSSLNWIYHELIARPAPPLYTSTAAQAWTWNDMINELGFSQTCLARARQWACANGLCHHSEALHTQMPSNAVKIHWLTPNLAHLGQRGSGMYSAQKTKFDGATKNLRQLVSSKKNLRLKPNNSQQRRLSRLLSCVAIKSGHIRAKQCENQSIIHCLKSREGIKSCTNLSHVAEKMQSQPLSHHVFMHLPSICACARPAHRWCGLKGNSAVSIWHCTTSYANDPSLAPPLV